jgi:hypothetical protein
MSKGLKLGLAILAFGCAIPLITAFLTLRKKPVYHTLSLPQENSFIQFTWQEKPVINVEHILIFFEKPSSYIASAGLDVRPPEKTDGYYIFPRGVFYKDEPLLQPIKKVLKRQKKTVKTWILHKGKAFPLELSDELNKVLSDSVLSFKGQNTETATLDNLLTTSAAWPEIQNKLNEFQAQVKMGKIDFTPRKRRSDFMTF